MLNIIDLCAELRDDTKREETGMTENAGFDVGLVMAGAISAGAYTAGVVDFLIEALDEWEKAKNNPEVPGHKVRLKVISGASAGAMTSAITVGALAARFPPIRNETGDNKENKLFDCWVNQIDIGQLLQDSDLRNDAGHVKSLLDSTVLRKIADNALSVTPSNSRRAYLNAEFHVLTTVANLRGVPYNIPLLGEHRIGHGMQMHADYMHFVLSQDGLAQVPGAFSLDWQKPLHWKTLKDAALASGAFPVGLAPGLLVHRLPGADPYAQRRWLIPRPGKDANGQFRCVEAQTISPSWPHFAPNYQYQFQCVDGGVMNNEPLELARQILAGSENYNPRGPHEANRAVILIDPFPSASFPIDYKPADDLLGIVLAIFNALKNQARFKPEEIVLAQDPKVFSRFLIAPTRKKLDPDKQEFAIASGLLGGFGGFLARDFRAHDFMLGRRNCQQFLRRRFVLGETNALFSEWAQNPDLRRRYRIEENGDGFFPVIPLVGTADTEVGEPDWPKYPQDMLDPLRDELEQRVGKVLDRLVRQYFARHVVLRFVAGRVVQRKRGDIVKFAIHRIEDDLRRFGLLV